MGRIPRNRTFERGFQRGAFSKDHGRAKLGGLAAGARGGVALGGMDIRGQRDKYVAQAPSQFAPRGLFGARVSSRSAVIPAAVSGNPESSIDGTRSPITASGMTLLRDAGEIAPSEFAGPEQGRGAPSWVVDSVIGGLIRSLVSFLTDSLTPFLFPGVSFIVPPGQGGRDRFTDLRMSAEAAMSAILGNRDTLPNIAWFDIGGTLKDIGGGLIPKTMGIIDALLARGIRIGIYSDRPEENILSFLSENSEIKALIGYDDDGEILVRGAKFINDISRELVRGRTDMSFEEPDSEGMTGKFRFKNHPASSGCRSIKFLKDSEEVLFDDFDVMLPGDLIREFAGPADSALGRAIDNLKQRFVHLPVHHSVLSEGVLARLKGVFDSIHTRPRPTKAGSEIIAKLRGDYSERDAGTVSELKGRFDGDVVKLNDGARVISYIYAVFNVISKLETKSGISRDGDLLRFIHYLMVRVKMIIDKYPERYAPPLTDGKPDIFNVLTSGSLRVLQELEKVVPRSKGYLALIAECYHIVGKYGFMFYATKNDGAVSEAELAEALITLFGAKKRFEALRMDSKAEEVVKDIEAIRESFNLPQEVENWVREYAVRGMGRGGIERTGNFDFYAEFLSQKRIPDRDEIKSALARWRRATVPGLLYRLFPVSVTPMTAIEGDHD